MVLVTCLAAVAPALAQDGEQAADIALFQAARTVLEQRCATCHMPEMPAEDAMPEGVSLLGLKKAIKSWNGPTDMEGLRVYLRQDDEPDAPLLADPATSTLVLVLQDPEDSMPPQKSPTGPLTTAEMATLMNWIDAGAPIAAVTPQAEPDAEPADADGPAETPADSQEDHGDDHHAGHDHHDHDHGDLPPAQATTDPAELALFTRVRQIATAHCSGCHQMDGESSPSRRVQKASEDWGGSEDMAALRGWISGYGSPIADPDQTDLMQVILHDPMPPKNAKTGPLSQEELQAFRDWVAAGAPVGDSQAAPAPEPVPVAEQLGRFHVMVVHFPIALIFVALLAELISWKRQREFYVQVATFCVVVGAASAIAAAALGWILADYQAMTELLKDHRLSGIVTVVLSILTALAYVEAGKSEGRGKLFWISRVLLLITALVTGLTGHLGGQLTFGPGYFPF